MSTLRRLLLSLPFGAAFLFSSTACVEYPKCKNDEHCAEKGEVCVAGFCKQCASDAQCEKGQECTTNNVCQYRIGYCDEGRPCPGTQKCRTNECGPECLSNDECSSDQFCDGGACAVKPECGVNADRESCDEGFDCQAGRCIRQMITCQPSEPIFFSFDSAKVNKSERSKLDEVSTCLRGPNAARVTLSGHADEVGETAYNLALGESRAQSVYDYLVRLEVPSSLLNTISYGEDRPAVDGRGRQPKNRRVEFEAR
jgi:peptidoglycan-associated lipoprotein